jgi:Raf kinase inhibitor-like YbhB/YbcL family protein
LAALALGACTPHDDSAGAPASSTVAAKPLALSRIKSKGGVIVVSSTAFADGGPIPDIYTAYGQGASPPVMWTPVVGAKSYAVLIEDPDAPGPVPQLHWLVYDVPLTATSLDDASQGGALPAGAQVGRDSAGTNAYAPLRPPIGDRPHHYYFEVFALDAPPAIPAGADLASLEHAMAGHVLASGETVGVYAPPPAGAPPAPTPPTHPPAKGSPAADGISSRPQTSGR